jgi:hypothetical protein
VQTGVSTTIGGPISFVVLFTHEDPDGSGGNYYRQNLAIFGPSSEMPLAIAKVVGKSHRAASLNRVVGTLINMDVLLYASEDPACCPSVEAEVTYAWANGQLEEVTMRLAPNNSLERSRER